MSSGLGYKPKSDEGSAAEEEEEYNQILYDIPILHAGLFKRAALMLLMRISSYCMCSCPN